MAWTHTTYVLDGNEHVIAEQEFPWPHDRDICGGKFYIGGVRIPNDLIQTFCDNGELRNSGTNKIVGYVEE